MKGYKRCKCRSKDNRELGNRCDKLRRRDGSWNPAHGTWYGKKDIPGAPGSTRMVLRQGGFATQEEMSDWFDEAVRLLSIPEGGPDGYEARAEILALIKESRRRKAPLPPHDDVRRRYAEGAAFQPGTTGDYLIGWLEAHRIGEDWSATTMLSYERAVERLFLPAFGKVALDKLRPKHVLDMFAGVDAENERIAAARTSDDPEVRASVAGRRPASLATKKRALAVLRSALADAMSPERRLVTVNVAAGVKLGKDRKRQGPKAKLWTAERERAWREVYEARAAERAWKPGGLQPWRSTPARPGPVMVWTPDHLGRFLDYAHDEDDRLYALFSVIAYCGLRRGEVCGIRWQDVDFDAGAVMIGQQVVQVGWKAVVKEDAKAESSEEWVRLAAVVTDTLRGWRRRQLEERVRWGQAWADTGFAFTHEDGNPYHPAQLTARFERLAYAAGLPPIRLHDLRHGAATLALAAGKDIKAVSAMLRHSSHKITGDIYASVLPELAAEVSSAVAGMVPRRAGGARPGARR